jgi:hypothetical protein
VALSLSSLGPRLPETGEGVGQLGIWDRGTISRRKGDG